MQIILQNTDRPQRLHRDGDEADAGRGHGALGRAGGEGRGQGRQGAGAAAEGDGCRGRGCEGGAGEGGAVSSLSRK